MKPITARQLETLVFIKVFIAKEGYSPSVREIAKETNCAVSSAQTLVEYLIKKGFIERSDGARTIKVVEQGDSLETAIQTAHMETELAESKLLAVENQLAIAVKALEEIHTKVRFQSSGYALEVGTLAETALAEIRKVN
jgi:SOS-response transcriptional repressor LexA